MLIQLQICDRFGYTLEQVRNFSYPDYKLYSAYIQKEPSSRSDAFLFGSLMTLTANLQRDSKREPFEIETFVPWFNQEIPESYMTEDEIKAKDKKIEDELKAALQAAFGSK